MLIGFILLVVFSVFIGILRRKIGKYDTGRQLLKVGDTMNTFMFFASIGIFLGIFVLLYAINKNNKKNGNKNNKKQK
tara:strand:- start:686 stop:916 length:231 start_codon:yes stop_codon:yes gene_type:complete